MSSLGGPNIKKILALTLVGPTDTGQVLDHLAVLLLETYHIYTSGMHVLIKGPVADS